LLKEFESITGVPVLLNTSFNIKGEPIVETPEDAIKCFLGTGMDFLVLNDTLLAKKPLHRLVSPMVGVYSDVRSLVGAAMTADMPH
jgi:carbamoyltransferase